jgi:hypothetical protein
MDSPISHEQREGWPEKCAECPLQINAANEAQLLYEAGNYIQALDWENIAKLALAECTAGNPTISHHKKFIVFGRLITTTECATNRAHGIREHYYTSET